MVRIFISLLCFSLLNNANEYDLVSWRDFDYHHDEKKSNRPNPANRIHDIKRVCHVDNKQNPSSDRAHQLFHDQKKCGKWNVKNYWDALVYAYGIYVPEGRLVSNDYIKTDGKRNGCTIYLDKNAFVHVMRQPKLYEYDNFWRFIQNFIEYESLFLQVFNGRINSALRNQMSQAAFYRIKNEYERLNDKRLAQENEQRTLREQSAVQNNFQKSLSAITTELEEWQELQNIADTYDLSNKEHFQKRLDALHEIRKGSINYTNQEYILNDDVVALLVSSKCDPEKYKTNYGNQLQQALHNECITIVSQTARLSPESPVYDYKESLVNLADASRGFNQEGSSHKASRLNDLCWSLLDYGSAIIEGIAQGAIGAIQDMIDHPLQTAACVVAGEYVLAYQLLKVTTQLADIGITYLQDPQAGKNSWNEYIQPLTTVIDTIANKELTLRDGIKGATALGVGCIAQQKMLKGLGSMYQTARVKAVEFTKNNPLVHPEAYMATSEGVVLKSASNLAKPSRNNIDNRRIKNHINDGDIRTIGQISTNFIDEAVHYVMENKVIHIFDKVEHNLNPLVEQLGGRENTVRAILSAAYNKLPTKGLFKDITVDVSGFTVYIRGCVIDGIPKIGTFFIK